MSSGSTTSDQCVLFCNPCWSRSIDLRALELRTAGMASAALFPTVLWRRVCVLEKQRPPVRIVAPVTTYGGFPSP